MGNKDSKKILQGTKTARKVTLIITSFREPSLIGRALEAAINQKTGYPYRVLVSAPDEETLAVARTYARKDSRITLFQDPGKGKSFALNLLLSRIDSDIVVLSDGDVFLSPEAMEEIVRPFDNPQIGCATGRPTPQDSKKNLFGYWAHFLFDAAHRMRAKSFKENKFIECSGYLFAFRKKEIEKIPLDVAEDSVIPYYFAQKGYRIAYAEKAQVFVKNPSTFKDWIKQKKRTAKAHENLEKYVDTKNIPRAKTFGNEAKGIFALFTYPQTIRELYWTLLLICARLYLWGHVLWDTRIVNNPYRDAWETVESTK